jgi:tripartite-type tricarboxylate transporter receptor subunit TctC
MKKIILNFLASIFLIPAMCYVAYPESPISLVIPYAAGGSADALARVIAAQMGPKLKGSVVVVNKPGASGVIGENFVAQARPDGYTVLYDATPLSINPFLQKLPFDPNTDLVPVSLVALTPMLLVVPKNSPFHSVQDVIDAAKKSPGKLTFGSGGQGTVQYMAGELFSQNVGISMLHIPFKSGTPAIMALVGGQIDVMFSNLPAISALVAQGELRPLAITASSRNLKYPNVPTIAESGAKEYQAYEWNGMFVPKDTPHSTIENLYRALKETLAMPEVSERIDSLGATVVGSSPKEFQEYLQRESKNWEGVTKKANITKE